MNSKKRFVRKFPFKMGSKDPSVVSPEFSLHKKCSFLLRISSVNVTKPQFPEVTFTAEILNGKLHFLRIPYGGCLSCLLHVFLNKDKYFLIKKDSNSRRFGFHLYQWKIEITGSHNLGDSSESSL